MHFFNLEIRESLNAAAIPFVASQHVFGVECDPSLGTRLGTSTGEEVEIELKKKSIFGLLKGWKTDAQSRKDERREIDG